MWKFSTRRCPKSYNAQAKQVPDDQKTFTTEFSLLFRSVHLLMQDMLHFLPQYLVDYYHQHCRGEDDMLIQLYHSSAL